MGPAPYFQEADNFAAYSSPSKVLFALAMITGRLEFFTVFALLLPELWRR
jgi:Trk-type K+ transport system membrane component